MVLENDLQSIIFDRLKKFRFAKLINNIRYYKGWLKIENYNADNFSIKSILIERYAKSVVYIYDMLANSEYELIGEENPKNISLDKVDRLYPDIIAHDSEGNFFIFELKVGHKTEREAITELFAYVFELKNHLPHINNSEISLVVISENFGTLLSHAVLQLVSTYGVKVMCLQFKYTYKDINLEIYDPIKNLTKNEFRLTKRALSTISVSLYQEKKYSELANKNIDSIFRIAEDMILEKANRINSNGFLVLYRNNDFDNKFGSIAKYYITIHLINPFELMDIELFQERGTPLSQALLNYRWESDGYHLQNHFLDIIGDCELFLSKFYNVRWESSLTYEQFIANYRKNFNVNAIKCNIWGDFGDYVKNIIYNPHSGYDILNGEIDHTNPFTLLEVISQLLDDKL